MLRRTRKLIPNLVKPCRIATSSLWWFDTGWPSDFARGELYGITPTSSGISGFRPCDLFDICSVQRTPHALCFVVLLDEETELGYRGRRNTQYPLPIMVDFRWPSRPKKGSISSTISNDEPAPIRADSVERDHEKGSHSIEQSETRASVDNTLQAERNVRTETGGETGTDDNVVDESLYIGGSKLAALT